MSWREFDGIVKGCRKRLIPEIAITTGKNRDGEPRFYISYRYHYSGVYAPAVTLDSALKLLRHYAEDDGFILEKCLWMDDSEYHPQKMVQDELF